MVASASWWPVGPAPPGGGTLSPRRPTASKPRPARLAVKGGRLGRRCDASAASALDGETGRGTPQGRPAPPQAVDRRGSSARPALRANPAHPTGGHPVPSSDDAFCRPLVPPWARARDRGRHRPGSGGEPPGAAGCVRRASGPRRRTGTGSAAAGVAPWYRAGVAVTCRWLAGARVDSVIGGRRLAPSPVGGREVLAYEELIEAEYLARGAARAAAARTWSSTRPGWCDGDRGDAAVGVATRGAGAAARPVGGAGERHRRGLIVRSRSRSRVRMSSVAEVLGVVDLVGARRRCWRGPRGASGRAGRRGPARRGGRLRRCGRGSRRPPGRPAGDRRRRRRRPARGRRPRSPVAGSAAATSRRSVPATSTISSRIAFADSSIARSRRAPRAGCRGLAHKASLPHGGSPYSRARDRPQRETRNLSGRPGSAGRRPSGGRCRLCDGRRMARRLQDALEPRELLVVRRYWARPSHVGDDGARRVACL